LYSGFNTFLTVLRGGVLNPSTRIKKNIAAIFRKWNLLEYKSPDDYVSVTDFYKVYGYACLYASLEKVPITDLTITFIESRYPEKLLDHLKNVRRYTVEETGHEIYNINVESGVSRNETEHRIKLVLDRHPEPIYNLGCFNRAVKPIIFQKKAAIPKDSGLRKNDCHPYGWFRLAAG